MFYLCQFVREQDYAKSSKSILMKPYTIMDYYYKNWFNFGVDKIQNGRMAAIVFPLYCIGTICNTDTPPGECR